MQHNLLLLIIPGLQIFYPYYSFHKSDNNNNMNIWIMSSCHDMRRDAE